MAGLVRSRVNQYQTAPGPGGMTGEQASSVYQGFYGEMPMPATAYEMSTAAIHSKDVVPSVVPNSANAAIVRRGNRRNGYFATDGTNDRISPCPPMYESPYSSKFQELLIGPIVNYVQNACLYRAGYPAASVMNGGLHNLALSTRVDQLVTRQTGGPGPAAMTPYPRFNRVQNVPRYATMPKSYPTESAPG